MRLLDLSKMLITQIRAEGGVVEYNQLTREYHVLRETIQIFMSNGLPVATSSNPEADMNWNRIDTVHTRVVPFLLSGELLNIRLRHLLYDTSYLQGMNFSPDYMLDMKSRDLARFRVAQDTHRYLR